MMERTRHGRFALALGMVIVAGALATALGPAAADSRSLAGVKIVVDPGHGGSDPGAIGFGINEKDVNLDVARRLRDLLVAEGATVVMTRDCDCTVSLSARSSLANNENADRFISVHSNACGSCGGHGTETYYHSGLSSGSTAAKLAGVVQEELVQHLGTRDRGVKTANFHVLRETNMPAVLAELAFIDHQGDNAKLASATYRQEAARGMLHAVQRHYGIAPHDPVTDEFAVSILRPGASAWLAGTATLQGSANEAVSWMRFLVDGTTVDWVTPAPHVGYWNTRGWSDGTHTLTLQAKSAAGELASRSMKVGVDNARPTVAITEPSNGGVYVIGIGVGGGGGEPVVAGSVTVRADAGDSTSGVQAVRFLVDGTHRATDSTYPYSWTWAAAAESSGSHTLTVVAVDRAGNTASASRDVTVV